MGSVNRYLIKCEDGYTEVGGDNWAYLAYGRREGFLSYPITIAALKRQAPDGPVHRLARLRSWPKLAITLGIAPEPFTNDEPYINSWRVGDKLWAPDADGNAHVYRVKAITVTEGEDGEIQFVPELSDITEMMEARLQRSVDRMVSGTQYGTTNVAGPVSLRPQPRDRPRLLEIPPFSQFGILTPAISPRWVSPIRTRLVSVTARLGTAGVTDTFFSILRNGSVVANGSVAGFQTTYYGDTIEVDLNPGDTVSVQLVTAGTGAQDLTVQCGITA